ncbi:substrate-binding domain-containing protein [Kitasatospora atroaurantiaca]|uniref:LacI family transcriptional regulator n=1 Tax=Kitasatospora atroaurantiaca TaxID=285545 RepID=A0A561F0G5_9ACTN|nr:LacI family DNA-binding transcriptional regulator [Kitasatospora atroaurantiaca]TWE21302.1 LacI family transcriptional regulator [Kitasatospora atroaurantiaca]
MVTMAEVAARAGVTKQTVSNVVSGKRVRPETLAKVNTAIAELGYKPNLVARSLRTGSTSTVGLFVPSVANAFYSEVVEEVENVLVGHGYNLLLATTRDDPDYTRAHLENLAARSVDALLVAGDKGVEQQLPMLTAATFPVALCAWEGEPPTTLPVVSIDYEHAGFLAGRHLRELGHRNVAVIADLPAHTLRVGGLRRAFAADGLDIDDRKVFTRTSDDAAGGYAAACAALDADPQLTAIFATHDVLAVGAIEAVVRSGRQVPEDVSVVGFDDIAQVGRIKPALTTVTFPKREMAQQAVELLLRAVDSGRQPTNVISLLRPTLTVRDSSAPPRATA